LSTLLGIDTNNQYALRNIILSISSLGNNEDIDNEIFLIKI